MNKSELIDAVAEETSLSKADASRAVDSTFQAIKNQISNGETVTITGFGSFSTKRRDARKGRNPSTGESIDIPASRSPVFKSGKNLKESVK